MSKRLPITVAAGAGNIRQGDAYTAIGSVKYQVELFVAVQVNFI